ncbi:unnamed protein product [Lactuca saligna]|uniref:SOSEKI DIX-like domain-containing protein n=1 Tax=Lactuca saligna TaxID=75948 RepID=A0AA36EPA6_LACSI|nr:unnamed protein product [Lactuca saligna]
MAADSRKTTSEMLISRRPKKNRNRFNAISGTGNRDLNIADAPDRSSILVKPKTEQAAVVMAARKVPVLYYLTRNGNLEHPHLIDVPLSSPHGLYLRDVMNTLNYHRGRGMSNMYSWSFKRSYKTGYVWHDVSEDDLIESTNGHGHDYVLKGSELLETLQNPTETNQTGGDCNSTTTAAVAMIKRRNQSWSSFDNPQEYMVVKCESSRELAAKFAADAATQTEEQRRRRSFERERKEHVTMTLGREEIPSPPPSNSSSEVSEGARYIDPTVDVRSGDLTAEDRHDAGGRMKASEVLMQLITCGVHKSILG